MDEEMSKYTVQQDPVETLLSWIKSGEIAIPEIQRPFVWSGTKVRDLIDSLYQGFPVGYIITWRNPDVRLKNGTVSNSKRILIDGQQRITALTAAIVGQRVLNKDYKEINIKIAFNPTATENDPVFEVLNNALEKSSKWINDISPILTGDTSISQARRDYMKLNPEADEDFIESQIECLKKITSRQIGIIELNHSLDIDTVTEIFIRINQKGVVLSNADFVMSKIASDTQYNGNTLRKMIDYFCHLLKDSSFKKHILDNDKNFASSDDYKQIQWISGISDDLYIPNYIDVLRVAFTFQFNRGKFSDLVALLSGRDFENRRYEEHIAEESYQKLANGLALFFNQNNYQRFITLIKSAGFINHKLIPSHNSVNFAYALYLKLKEQNMAEPQIQHFVKRWFVMSLLTGRYTGSSESAIDKDINLISEKGISTCLQQVEQSELDIGFWEYRIVNDLETSSTVNNAYNCYLAAQCQSSISAFLSQSMSVRHLIEQRGDVHHLFPKDYLIKNGFNTTKEYNQVANYAYTEQATNIKVSNVAPKEYMALVSKEILEQKLNISSMKSIAELKQNMRMNCIPETLFNADSTHYEQFLLARRKLMAATIKNFYQAL